MLNGRDEKECATGLWSGAGGGGGGGRDDNKEDRWSVTTLMAVNYAAEAHSRVGSVKEREFLNKECSRPRSQTLYVSAMKALSAAKG